MYELFYVCSDNILTYYLSHINKSNENDFLETQYIDFVSIIVYMLIVASSYHLHISHYFTLNKLALISSVQTVACPYRQTYTQKYTRRCLLWTFTNGQMIMGLCDLSHMNIDNTQHILCIAIGKLSMLNQLLFLVTNVRVYQVISICGCILCTFVIKRLYNINVTSLASYAVAYYMPLSNETKWFMISCLDITFKAVFTFMMYTKTNREVFNNDSKKNTSHKIRVLENNQTALDKYKADVLDSMYPSDSKNYILRRSMDDVNISVMFMDIVGFSGRSADMPSHQVYEELNDLYTRYDDNLEKWPMCRKYETVADSYIVTASSADAQKLVVVSLEFIEIARTLGINVRCGVHIGQVTSGVAGYKQPKFSYFGNVMNFASRLESTAHPCTVNVSEDVYKSLIGTAPSIITERDNVYMKNIGYFKTYTISKRPPCFIVS